MKVYLFGSMTAGRDYASALSIIAKTLEEEGHVIITPFVIQAGDDFSGRKAEKSKYIFERDMALIQGCDVAVGEISQPSHGVGYELAELVRAQKSILCLRHDSLQGRMMSALIEGNSGLKVLHYNDEQLAEIVNEFMSELKENKEGSVMKEREL